MTRPAVADIRAWLIDEVATLTRTCPAEIDLHEPFLQYGIGSSQALELAAKLEDWVGVPLAPTAVWDYPNIDALARHLAEPLAGDESDDLQAVR